jgi:hypothetical protein
VRHVGEGGGGGGGEGEAEALMGGDRAVRAAAAQCMAVAAHTLQGGQLSAKWPASGAGLELHQAAADVLGRRRHGRRCGGAWKRAPEELCG